MSLRPWYTTYARPTIATPVTARAVVRPTLNWRFSGCRTSAIATALCIRESCQPRRLSPTTCARWKTTRRCPTVGAASPLNAPRISAPIGELDAQRDVRPELGCRSQGDWLPGVARREAEQDGESAGGDSGSGHDCLSSSGSHHDQREHKAAIQLLAHLRCSTRHLSRGTRLGRFPHCFQGGLPATSRYDCPSSLCLQFQRA